MRFFAPKYHYRLLLYVFLLQASLSFAQISKPLQEKTYGDIGHDRLYDMIESTNGDIWAIGESEVVRGIGTQAMIYKINDDSVIKTIPIYDNGNTKGISIAEDELGQLFIAGQTEEYGTKDKRIWLKKLDINQRELWSIDIDKGDDKLSLGNLVYDINERLISICGTQNESIWFAQYDTEGNVFKKKSQFSKAVTYSMTTNAVNIRLINEELYLFGIFVNLGKEAAYPGILKLDKYGNLISDEVVTFPDIRATSAGNLIELSADKLALVGTTYGRRPQIFYLSFEKTLDKKDVNYAFLKHLRDDEGQDIVKVGEDRLYIASNSIPKMGADNKNIVLFEINADGKELNKSLVLNHKYKNWARKFLLKKDGSLWLGGTKDNAGFFSTNYDFHITELAKLEAYTPTASIAPSDITFDKAQFTLQERTPIITNDTTQYVQLVIQNNSDRDLNNLLIEASCEECTKGLIPNPNYRIQELKTNTSKLINYPITSNKSIQNDINKINLTLKSNGEPIKSLMIEVETKRNESFKLVGHSFKTNEGNFAIQGKSGILQVYIQNTGLNEVKNAEIVFTPERNAEIFLDKDKSVFTLKNIRQGTIDTITIPLRVGLNYDRETFFVKAFIKNAYSEVISQFTISELVKKVEFEPIPVEEETITQTQILEIKWIDDERINEKETRSKEQSFKVSINEKDITLKREKFKIIIIGENGDSAFFHLIPGKKADEVDIWLNQKKGKQTTLDFTVPLTQGENAIIVEYKDENIYAITEIPHYIHYSPKELGTLYVLSVGIPYEDSKYINALEYSTKDASDFANLFKNQKGVFFDSINIKILDIPNLTRSENIYHQLKQFAYKNDRFQLAKEDAIVLFFSGHGEMHGEDFIILDSGVSKLGKDKYTMLNYNEQIVPILEDLPCQKFVFFDACRARNINEDISKRIANKKGGSNIIESQAKAINNRIKASTDTRTLMSCKDGQFSLEAKPWKNGAFTKALIELISNKEECKRLDTNEDGGLSISEIYYALGKRINNIIATVDDFRDLSQSPEYNKEINIQEDPPFLVY